MPLTYHCLPAAAAACRLLTTAYLLLLLLLLRTVVAAAPATAAAYCSYWHRTVCVQCCYCCYWHRTPSASSAATAATGTAHRVRPVLLLSETSAAAYLRLPGTGCPALLTTAATCYCFQTSCCFLLASATGTCPTKLVVAGIWDCCCHCSCYWHSHLLLLAVPEAASGRPPWRQAHHPTASDCFPHIRFPLRHRHAMQTAAATGSWQQQPVRSRAVAAAATC